MSAHRPPGLNHREERATSNGGGAALAHVDLSDVVGAFEVFDDGHAVSMLETCALAIAADGRGQGGSFSK